MGRDADRETLDYYHQHAPVYSASGLGGVNRFLHLFLDRLQKGARILDLGCGGGRDSQEMLHLGFDVVSTDASVPIAEQAATRIGRPVIVQRFDELEVVADFDAVWGSASLLHVPIQSLPGVLARVHTALRPNGLHFANYKSGGAEGRDSDGRYFNYLSEDQLLNAYETSGNWTVLSSGSYVGGGYEGDSKGPWVSIVTAKL